LKAIFKLHNIYFLKIFTYVSIIRLLIFPADFIRQYSQEIDITMIK